MRYINIYFIILLLQIVQRVGYETSKPGYESSGYERSMGTKRLVTETSMPIIFLRPG